MTDKISGEVENLEQVLERWLEYGMTLSITHKFAVALVPACIKALEEVNAYRMDTLIKLPNGVSITRANSGETTNLCPASAIIQRFQLTDWLKDDWDIEKYKREIEKARNEIPNSE